MAGKYALIEVPDFDPDIPSLDSFLRLGAYPTDFTGLPGYDLASKFPGYFDDDRKREGGPDYRTPEARKAETDKLFTRGGWWDHSDGNRISTTRGDKLEVIRGNYRLAVLGWQDDWGESAGQDMSGGIIRDPQRLPGEIYSVEWKNTWGGTWYVTEKLEKGDLHSTYWGNKEEYAYGDTWKSTVGSESPSDDEPNPEITEKTWAKTIKGYTGSASLPITELYDETWALNAVDNTFLMTKTGTTSILGALTETTMAANIISNELYSTKMSVEFGQAHLDIGMLASKTELSIIPNVVAAQIHASTLDFNATAVKTDIFAGNKVDASLGGSLGLMGGLAIDIAMAGKIGITLGVAVDLFIGGKIDVLAGIGLDVAPFKFGLKNEDLEWTSNKSILGFKLSLG